MSDQMRRFEDFKIDDWVTFDRVFQVEDYQKFAEISGDLNPLHASQSYAEATSFGQTIVPLHLSSACFSRIAGMVFPGDPSLYHGNEISALNPVFFNEKINYSAKISAISAANRLLELSVIAWSEPRNEVVLKGKMKVQCLQEAWVPVSDQEQYNSAEEKRILITGAGGEIGSAIARQFIQNGWSVILHSRTKENQTIEDLCALAERNRIECRHIEGDLSSESGRRSLQQNIFELDYLSGMIHCASAPVESSLAVHTEVTYVALKELTEACLPIFQRQQNGKIVFLGSSAMTRTPKGWEDYAASKSMAVNYLNNIHDGYKDFGICAATLAPGYVQTGFSDQYRSDDDFALLPEEIAQAAWQQISESSDKTYVTMGRGQVNGHFGFYSLPSKPANKEVASVVSDREKRLNSGGLEQLDQILRQVFALDDNYDLTSARLGETPNWDSLKHIEMILTLEKALSISFSSAELGLTHSYADLMNCIGLKFRK